MGRGGEERRTESANGGEGKTEREREGREKSPLVSNNIHCPSFEL